MPLEIRLSAWHANYELREVRWGILPERGRVRPNSPPLYPLVLVEGQHNRTWNRLSLNRFTFPRTRRIPVVVPLSATQLPQALDQMSGEIYGTLPVITRENINFAYRMLNDRLRDSLAGAALWDDAQRNLMADGWTGWVFGYGRGGQASADQNAHGFDYSLGGTLVALERSVGPEAQAGLFFNHAQAFANSDGDLRHGTDVESNHGGAYLTMVTPIDYLVVMGGMGYDEYDTGRSLAFGSIDRTATSENHGWHSSVRGEYGRIHGAPELNLQPFGGLHFTHVHQDSITESG